MRRVVLFICFLSLAGTAAAQTITSFAPAYGTPGTSVTISGNNFDPTPGNNVVKFNGITAAVTASSSTSITATVPIGVTTGLISVTVGGNTATSSSNFIVLPLQCFTDDFDGSILDARWTVINPNPSSTVALTGSGKLQLKASPLNGGSDYFSPTNFNAPRVVTPIVGDWIIETQMSFSPGNNNYQGAGLLLLSETNPSSITGNRIAERAFSPGGNLLQQIRSVGSYSNTTATSFYLKVQKIGTTLTGWYGPNSTTLSGPFTVVDAANYTFAGLFAVRQPYDGNTTVNSTATFDYFKLSLGTPPTITSFSPSSTSIGSSVTITGTNFDPTLANNIVKFNGIAATVTASTLTSITTTVPAGASSGFISVTVGCNTATSTNVFCVPYTPASSNGLIASYDFNGNFNDASSNSNNAINNGVTFVADRCGNPASAIFLNGTSSSRVTIPTSSSMESIIATQELTVSAWFSIASSSPYVFPILERYNPNVDNGMLFEVNTYVGGTLFNADYAGSNTICNHTWATNEWHQISITYSKAKAVMNFYADGILICSNPYSQNITTDMARDFYIGTSFSGPDEFAYGAIDDFKFYNRALSDCEISSLYNTTSITSFTPSSGPVGTQVTITGTSFDPTPANNIVKFNGVAATVTASTSTSITTTVPSGATTGTISVQIGCYTVTSASIFVVSAVGNLIYYGRSDGTIYSSTADGNPDIFITNGYWPKVSPDGRYLLFRKGSQPTISNKSIYVRDLTTNTENLAFNNPNVNVNSNGADSWFYDNSKILFDFDFDIRTVNRDGTGITVVSNANGVDDAPDVRADGASMTFENYLIGLFTANINGTSRIQIPNTIPGDHLPQWSRDSKWITFTRTNVSPVVQYKIHPDGTGLTALTNLSSGDLIYNVSWTNDGSNLIASGKIACIPGLFLIPTDGSKVIKRLATPLAGADPSFVGGVVGYPAYSFTPLNPTPTITSFTPSSGSIGSSVTITGTNFDPTQANNIVKFNGVTTIVTASTATSITTFIPAGATTGTISVQVGCSTVTSTTNFSILPHSPLGNTVTLNGTTDYILVPDNASLKPSSVTVEAWVKVSAFTSTKGGGNPQFQTILFKKNTRTTFFDGYTIALDEANKKFQVAVNSSSGIYLDQSTPNNSVVLNQWYHIALTANSTELRMYVNGTQVGAPVATGFPLDYDTSPLVIGRTNQPYEGFFNGVEDEVRIWNTIRTQTEILSTMNSTLVGNEPGLVAYYKMDEVGAGAGITVNNSTTATGSILNGTTFGTACTPVFTTPLTPTISSISPSSGSVGASITITGTNFSSSIANNIVKFNGVNATVTASTSTSITAIVPTGATTGAVTVTICSLTGTSASSFSVNNLVASYTFIGNADDASGFGNNGTVTGATLTIDPLCNPGQAYLFDGNDYIKVLDSPTLRPTDLTLAGWFKFTSSTGTQLLIDKHVGAGSFDSYEMWLESGSLWGTIGNASTFGPFIQFPFVPASGTWYHLAYTFNDASNTQRLFINGIKVAESTVNVSIGYDSEPLLLGASNDFTTPNSFFNGLMDDVKIYNRDLLPTEINTLFLSVVPASPPTITAFSPTTASVGSSITITGTNFNTVQSNNSVKFNGVSAVISSSTTTSIVANVPVGTTTGPIEVSNGCYSVVSSTNFTICTAPSAPTTTGASSCGSASITLTAVGGTNGQYRWYTVASGGTPISGEVNNSYTTPALTSTTDYYVSINNGTCESARTKSTATVNTIPSAPLATGASGCTPISLTLNASGGTNGQYRWYTVSTGGTAISGEVNSTYTTTSLTATTDYYVSINNGTCESTRAKSTATVNVIPSSPTVTGASACAGSSVTLTASGASNGQYRWYTVATGGTAISGQVNSSFITPALSTSTTYYVSINNGICESPRAQATATIQPCITNQPPEIKEQIFEAVIEGKVTVNLVDLLSDPDNNLDLSTLKIITQPGSGARASIDAQHNLVLDYTGISFTGIEILTVQVCDLLGSCTQRELSIAVAGDVIIYSGFSPNNDGINDFFFIRYIEDIEDTKNNHVFIFNRWGDAVFDIVNYDNKNNVFKGLNNNGNIVSSGVYFYKIEFLTGRKTITGYVTLSK